MNLITYRKPHNIPTTRGTAPCFLETIKDKLPWQDHPEYGLLNRLDNQTCGLLFFAPDQATYDEYKILQAQHKIQKIYLTEVYGQFRPLFFWITTPIAHHRDNAEKMICIENREQGTINNEQGTINSEQGNHVTMKLCNDVTPYRGSLHHVTTYCEKLAYNPETDTTTLQVTITKGIRHQIRCHLAHRGHSIVNDNLYTPKKLQKKRSEHGTFDPQGNLQLMSMGMKIVNSG